MRITLRTLFAFFCFQSLGLVYANDNLVDADKASAIPVQKNSSVVSGASKEDSAANPEQFPSMSNADKQKAPKDTSLNLTGNGGSTNRSAGGNAMFRKRFTF